MLKIKKLRNRKKIENDYATLEDHTLMIRSKLTGQPFPESVNGKVPNPIFTSQEEAMITEEVVKNLQSEGYVLQGEIWQPVQTIQQNVEEKPAQKQSIYEF